MAVNPRDGELGQPGAVEQDVLLKRQDEEILENEEEQQAIMDGVKDRVDELLTNMQVRTDYIYGREMAMARIGPELEGRLSRNIEELDRRTEHMTVHGEKLQRNLERKVSYQKSQIGKLKERMADRELEENRERKAMKEENARNLREMESAGKSGEVKVETARDAAGERKQTRKVKRSTSGGSIRKARETTHRKSTRRKEAKYFEVIYDYDKEALYSRVPLYCRDCGTKYDMAVEFTLDSMPEKMGANCPKCESRYRINMSKFWERADISGLPEELRQWFMDELYSE